MLDPLALFSLSDPERSPHREQALTHSSFANEQPRGADNQRLEFLGDAVLQLCASEFLYREYPNADEGELTRRRAQLVNSEALADLAREVGIAHVLRLGKGAEAHGLRANTSVLADAVEALIAASYLDAGMDAAKAACVVLLRLIQARTDEVHHHDAKSELQERVQARGLEAPVYTLLESGGPSHDPWFEVAVVVQGSQLARGKGRSKRQAEREAAKAALATLPQFLQRLDSGGTP